MAVHNIRSGGAHSLIGGQWAQATVSATADATTTDSIDIRGMAFGTVYNESGAQVVKDYPPGTLRS